MPGTNLEIPGLEAILEYGDASKVVRDHIPGAMLINDHSRLDRVRITQMDGLHDDPEGSETRQPNPDRHGESAGAMLYRGRTIGFTGRVEAGNIGAMRNNWRRFRGQFGTFERDLLVHHPFEVRALANEVPNPVFAVDTQTWSDPFTTSGSATLDPATLFGGTTTMGALAVTGTTGAGSVRTTTNLLDDAFFLPQVQPWTGQDVWITALVRVASTTLAVGAVSLGLTEWFHAVPGVGASSTVPVAATKVVQNSPVTGTWYLLSLRVSANAFKPSTTYVTPTVQLDYSSGGNATLNVTAVAVVFVDADEPSPVSYFDGDVAGYDWEGVPNLSRSIGPTHAENMVVDPRFEDFNASTSVLTNWTYEAASITVNTVPSRSFGWTGDDFDAAGYFRATKDNSTAARSYGVVATGNVLTKFRVVAGRRYRWSIKANLVQKPTGTVVAAIQWYDLAGALVSTSSSDPLVLGVNDATVTAAAPPLATWALCRLWTPSTSTALDPLEMFFTRPCFVDVTDWDPGDFVGDGDPAEEVGNRRRIPRPFLLSSVRKTSDMKAPEQQSRSRAWRDFTMSLRASDPRVYCLDRRRRSYDMPLKTLLKSTMQPMNGFITSTLPALEPTGSSFEGQSIPATAPNRAGWTNYSTAPGHIERRPTPYGGINLDLWTDNGGALIARPTSPVLARFYRFSEGYLYNEPRVIAGCSPVAQTAVVTGGPRPSLASNNNAYGYSLIIVSPDITHAAVYANTANILIKRVNSTTWLELRWSALSNGRSMSSAAALFHPSSPTAIYAFELWCSHNASGTLATTRLATWDYTHVSSASVLNVPFNPTTDKAYLEAYLLGNVVSWALWINGYPGPIGTDNPARVESGSYAFGGGLATVIGSGVDGRPGFAMKVDNPPTESGG
jgi:hypothetical protein